MPKRPETEKRNSELQLKKRVKERDYLGKTRTITLQLGEDFSVSAQLKKLPIDSNRVHYQLTITNPELPLETGEVKAAIEALVNQARVRENPDITKPVRIESTQIEWLSASNTTANVHPITKNMMNKLGMKTDTNNSCIIEFTIPKNR